MHSILLVDFSEERHDLVFIFENAGYRVDLCESAFDAMSKLRAYDYDLVVSEVELPGDNAFDLYNYLQQEYPYIPTIMTTVKNIDNFFEAIFREGIGNVITKPVDSNKLLALSKKLITKEKIFGLENYLNNIITKKKIRLNKSILIQKAIDAIIGLLRDWGYKVSNEIIFQLILSEMLINAIYHSHGYTDEKKARKSIELPEGDFVEIFFGHNGDLYGISIVDHNGILTKAKILDSINQVIEQNNLIEQAVVTGEDISDKISETGRGIDLARKLASEYYFIIHENKRTEIILLFDKHDDDIDFDEFNTSLKIIEVFSQ